MRKDEIAMPELGRVRREWEALARRRRKKKRRVTTDITVSGAGSEFSAETNGKVMLGGAQAAPYSDGVSEVNVSVADGATAKISGKTVNIGRDASGGNRAKVDVDIAASGEGSSLEIEATDGSIFLNYRGDVTSELSAEKGATLSLGASGWISVGNGATITAAGGTLETTATGGVLLESGAELVLGDDAVWTAAGDVTLKSGAEMTVSIATTGNAAADIKFSNNAQLAFESGAVLNLTLGESETLAVLQDRAKIYLGPSATSRPQAPKRPRHRQEPRAGRGDVAARTEAGMRRWEILHGVERQGERKLTAYPRPTKTRKAA